MKEKLTQVKDYVIKHKKQILIGTGVVCVAVVGVCLYKHMNKVEVYEDVEELTGGTIEEVK